jgi:hypothetical protein
MWWTNQWQIKSFYLQTGIKKEDPKPKRNIILRQEKESSAQDDNKVNKDDMQIYSILMNWS